MAVDDTKRSVTINIDGNEVKGCAGLGMTAVKVNSMEEKLDVILEKLDALDRAKRDGGVAGGIVGAVASGVALFLAYIWSLFSGG